MHIHTHTHIHTYTLTHAHTDTHTLTHAHTDTHSDIRHLPVGLIGQQIPQLSRRITKRRNTEENRAGNP